MSRFLNACMALLLFLNLLLPHQTNGTHLMGGELTYVYDGSMPGGKFYVVNLIVYRYCDSTINPAPLDQSMFLGIYTGPTGGPLNWTLTEFLTLTGSTFVTSNGGSTGCNFTATACIERGEYEAFIFLPDTVDGYHLFVERCCRNGNIGNINLPGSAGMTYYAFIPPGIINSTPQITDVNIPYLCSGDTISIVNNAFDPDGDSLSYEFIMPYNGYSSTLNAAPDPELDNNPYILPIPEVVFAPGYNLINVFGPGTYASIDPVTGLTNYYVPNQGFYVAAIEIKEYRNGVQISAIRRDLQFVAIVCTPNNLPVITTPGSNTFSIGEGQTLCFTVTASDSEGDSLYLTASGPLLDSTLVNPSGTIAAASGDSMVSSQFCWTPVCGMANTVPYQFFITIRDNGCPAKIINEIYSVYVTSGPASQTPAVAVQQFPQGLICQGSTVTFNANPVLPGNAPVYQWYLNGSAAGTNSSSFVPASLNNGDVVTVTMISNAPCAITDTAHSPPYPVVINSQPAPQLSLTSNPADFLCPQQICFFNCSVTNGGAPSYQWYLNGTPSGSNGPVFTAANPSGIMTVYAVVTPSTGCPPETTDTIVFDIQPILNPDAYITASTNDSLCPGEQLSFTADASDTGEPPEFAWYLNGTFTGNTTSQFSFVPIAHGDEVYVTVTSDYECLSPATATSDVYTVNLFSPLQVAIEDGPLEICSELPLELEYSHSGGNSATWTLSWEGGGTTFPGNVFIPPATGYYTLTADDECFLPVKDSVFVEVLPLPFSDFIYNPENPSIFIPHVQFTNLSTGAIAWNWQLDSVTSATEMHPSHDYPVSGDYPVRLVSTNQFGCTDTMIRVIEIENIITAYVPNSFTPNGDGINDLFGLSGFATGGYAMSIYNRWGIKIFNSESGYGMWNGKATDGDTAPAGVYVYSIRLANDKTGKLITGTFTLYR